MHGDIEQHAQDLAAYEWRRQESNTVLFQSRICIFN